MKDNLYTLTVLRNLLKNNVIRHLAMLSDNEVSKAEFINSVFNAGCENNLLGYIEEEILTDENAFSIQCALKKTPSDILKNAFKKDISILFAAIDKVCNAENLNKGSHIDLFGDNADCIAANLAAYYSKYGYGKFIRNAAFKFVNDKLEPICTTSHIALSDLKDYAEEKEIIERNITGFINGLPALNMLLYGDKGTGKSSTIHAMSDKYFNSGLRIIETDAESVMQINEIRRCVANIPLKFIIFIDDMSFDSGDSRLPAIKASFEGSFYDNSSNILIVATSNRRHAIKENFSDRQDAVYTNDLLDEQLSLSDRFGLTVLFSTTNKQQYLSIVKQLAEDYNLKTDSDELFALAERWALIKGGRSPRHAKQFIEFAYSSLSRGLSIEF